jgi:heat shock protein HslJ
MKFHAVSLLILVIVIAILSGCTGQQPAAPVTTPATVLTTVAPATDLPVPPGLAGNWTLSELGIQGGNAPIMPVAENTLQFNADSTLNGYDGCNNYYATVHINGNVTPFGTGMTLGPVGRSTKQCQNIADQEQIYFDILERTRAYAADSNQLTLKASNGDILVYKRPVHP